MGRLGRQVEFVSHTPRLGVGLALGSLADAVWGTKVFLGLRADLSALPEVRPAKVRVVMEPTDLDSYTGFDDELEQTTGTDHAQVLFRVWLASAGVRELYSARADDGAPIYAQWLVRHRDQHLLRASAPGRHPELAPDEVLLEGAYTFGAFRRMGVMADGMSQLLAIAAAEGLKAALTYVEADNVASARGCASAGFDLDHQRVNTWRLGRSASVVRPPDAAAQEIWRQATAPAGGPRAPAAS
jgi:L-amino acid N-acyltransferase YncA